MTLEEIQQHHDTLGGELVNLKNKLSVMQLDNPLQVRVVKKEIARAKTILRDKNLGAKPGELSAAKDKS